MASQALTRNVAFTGLQGQLEKHVPTLAMALPRMPGSPEGEHLARAQRAARVAMTQLRDPKKASLLDCDPASILSSVLAACQLGLELDGVMGQACLVPYKSECQMQVGYRGLSLLAVRSGKIAYVMPSLIYENEKFVWHQGTEPEVFHEPKLVDRGKLVGVYAIAPLVGKVAIPPFRVLNMEEVGKRQKMSKASRSDSPWKVWYEEMVLKTAVRALCKHLPQCPEAQRAAVADEYIDAGHAPPRQTIESFAEEAMEIAAAEVIDEPPEQVEPGSRG